MAGGVDGIFGQGTSNAVKTFQSSKGLTSSGVVNSTTAFLLGLSPSPALPILGQRGAIVTALQQAVTDASISVRGGIDGIFGAATTKAVSAYQTSRGITATGVVDITTAISLGIVEGSAQSTAQPTTTVPTTTAPTTTAPPTTPSPFPLSLEILGASAMCPEGRPPLNSFQPDDRSAPNSSGSWTGAFLNARAGTIYAGSSQIQSNIIGEMVLGLPKEPR